MRPEHKKEFINRITNLYSAGYGSGEIYKTIEMLFSGFCIAIDYSITRREEQLSMLFDIVEELDPKTDSEKILDMIGA